jgi:hypothetical protein
MELREATTLLASFNRWRRGDESLDQPCPRAIGVALDTVLAELKKRTPEEDAEWLADKRCEYEADRICGHDWSNC